jgi:hypothetical protein
MATIDTFCLSSYYYASERQGQMFSETYRVALSVDTETDGKLHAARMVPCSRAVPNYRNKDTENSCGLAKSFYKFQSIENYDYKILFNSKQLKRLIQEM